MGDSGIGFSVIIATIGRGDPLREALASVVELDPPAREIIVVDGDPRESARNVTTLFADRVTHVRARPGLTRQRNAGLRAATEPLVLFLDDDVDVPIDLLERLARAFRDPTVLGVTGLVIEPSGNRRVGKTSHLRRSLFGGGREGGFTRFGYPRRVINPDIEQDVCFMPGCFMSVRRAVALRIGFDEELPGYGLAEDEDFACRLSRVGRIRYLPDAHVHHKNLGFLAQDPRAFGQEVVINRTYLFRKNFAPTTVARSQFALFVGVLVAHRLLNREWRGAQGVVEGAWKAWRLRPR